MSVTWGNKVYATWDEVRALEAAKAAVAVVAPPAPPPPPPAPLELSGAVPTPPAKRRALTERYRPRRLAELVGQPEAVRVLSAFAADPYPTAFIFAGDTGCGKTSAAWALAGDLGCDLEGWAGGVHSIASGEHTADNLRDIWPGLWTIPDNKSGWRVLIVNETEALSAVVEKLWMDKLEDMPPKLVVIFTTNALNSLAARFVDRCIGGVLEFRSAADDLGEGARELARTIWRGEGGGEIPVDVMEKVIQRATSAGRLSLRRVVQALTPLIGKGKL